MDNLIALVPLAIVFLIAFVREIRNKRCVRLSNQDIEDLHEKK